MDTYSHGIPFKHSCGLDGTILKILITRHGVMIFEGVCVVCGEEFDEQFSITDAIAKAAVADYREYRKQNPQDILEDFEPDGKPN